VSYRSYTEEYINSTGIFGDVIVSLLATLAKQETIRLSERTIAGLERARAQGRVGGRPRIDCNRGKLLKLLAAGKSLGEISRELGISKTTVHRIVKGSC
jgi:DNA invertase Pin-like site-specific DNA recombinase